MRVLVTGAAGFLGGAIARAMLDRGDDVVAYCRRDSIPLRAAGAQVIEGDVCDRDRMRLACRGVDAVVHAAAVAGLWGAWRTYAETNIEGTRSVIQACLDEGVGRLVYSSTASVVFDGRPLAGVDESIPYPRRWLNHYSRSKALAEQLVLRANGCRGSGAPLRTCALRPHAIWGPGDRKNFPRLVALAREGRLRQIGDGANLIDPVYIDNAVAAHLQSLEALDAWPSAAGGAYFIGQEEPVRFWDWINALLAGAGAPIVARRLPFAACWCAATLLECAYAAARVRAEPPVTRYLVAQFAKSKYFNLGRARRQLGYTPPRSFAEAMQAMAAAQTMPTTRPAPAQICHPVEQEGPC